LAAPPGNTRKLYPLGSLRPTRSPESAAPGGRCYAGSAASAAARRDASHLRPQATRVGGMGTPASPRDEGSGALVGGGPFPPPASDPGEPGVIVARMLPGIAPAPVTETA